MARIQHPDYVKDEEDPAFNYHKDDISLLKTQVPVVFSDEVQPICLSSQEYMLGGVKNPSNLDLEGNKVLISGWGETQAHGYGSFPSVLQYGEFEVFNQNVCDQIWFYMEIRDTQICISTDGPDEGSWESGDTMAPCTADSGGPWAFRYPGSEKYVLAGIQSFGARCGMFKRPSVGTRISEYALWIYQNTG